MIVSRRFATAFSTLTVFLGVIFGISLSLSGIPAYGDTQGNAGTDGGGGSKGCYKNKTDTSSPTWFDSCFGGGWMVHDTNGRDSIDIPKAGDVNGGTVKGCASIGADKYYTLGLIQFKTNDSHDPSKFEPVLPLTQKGLWPVKRFASVTGANGYTRLFVHDGLEDWNDVYQKFTTAKEKGAGMNGHEWNEISWFCYNTEWDEDKAEGSYWTTSTASIPAQDIEIELQGKDVDPVTGDRTTTTISGRIEGHPGITSPINGSATPIEYYTTAKSIKVDFHHNIYHDESLTRFYEGNTLSESFLDHYYGKYRADRDYESKNMLCTQWDAKDLIDRNESRVTGGLFCPPDSSGQQVATQSMENGNAVEIELDPGKWTTVCGKIDFTPETNKVETQYYNPDDPKYNDYPDGEQYIVNSSGANGSSACVRIYRSDVTVQASFWGESTVNIPAYNAGAPTVATDAELQQLFHDNAKLNSKNTTIYTSSNEQSHDVNHHIMTSGQSDGDGVMIRLSADGAPGTSNFTANFFHNMYISPSLYQWDYYENPTECQNTYDTGDSNDLACKISVNDVFPNICATWQIDNSDGTFKSNEICTKDEDLTSVSIDDPSGELSPAANGYKRKIINNEDHNFVLNGGTGYESYSEILSYQPVMVVLGRREIYHYVEHSCATEEDPDCTYSDKHFDHFEYYTENIPTTDPVKTSAGVEVNHLTSPSGTLSLPNDSEGIIYAGEEQGDVSWQTKAYSQAARRLKAYQATVYSVLNDFGYSSDAVKGNLGDVGNRLTVPSTQEPSSVLGPFINSRYNGQSKNYQIFGSVSDDNLSDGDSGDGGRQTSFDYSTIEALTDTVNKSSEVWETKEHSTNYASNFVTPDEVGEKYCSSYAYLYEHWISKFYFNSKSPSSAPAQWEHENIDNALDYWEIFDSKCRTIAKKPSFAVWNGSFMTTQGVGTSISTRFNDPVGDFAQPVSLISDEEKIYGSWTEYLAAIGLGVDGFTSGADLGAGSTVERVGQSWRDSSQMTIANVTNIPGFVTTQRLGYSDITTNSTYRLRLRTYFENLCGSNVEKNATWNTLVNANSLTCYKVAYDDNQERIQSIPNNLSGFNIILIDASSYADGTYTLQQPISVSPSVPFSGEYSNIYQIPRTIIFVNGNLNISQNVRHIDAWLVVSGTINTCPNYRTGATRAAVPQGEGGDIACENKLIFNGPVRASNIIMRRSFGSDLLDTDTTGEEEDNNKYTPAEVFNYRADDYLWAYAQASRYNSSYVESYSRELAPRY